MALAETKAWAAGASRSVAAVTNPVIVFFSFICSPPFSVWLVVATIRKSFCLHIRQIPDL